MKIDVKFTDLDTIINALDSKCGSLDILSGDYMVRLRIEGLRDYFKSIKENVLNDFADNSGQGGY